MEIEELEGYSYSFKLTTSEAKAIHKILGNTTREFRIEAGLTEKEQRAFDSVWETIDRYLDSE